MEYVLAYSYPTALLIQSYTVGLSVDMGVNDIFQRLVNVIKVSVITLEKFYVLKKFQGILMKIYTYSKSHKFFKT